MVRLFVVLVCMTLCGCATANKAQSALVRTQNYAANASNTATSAMQQFNALLAALSGKQQ